MIIYTPIESPCRFNTKKLFFKINVVLSSPKMQKKKVQNFFIFNGKGPPYDKKKEKKFFSHQYMTIHTPIESPCRVDKKYSVFKII
jgi:hypothetical protein